ncbi:MAG: ABC transporter ATP-binding protein [Firmicutes bacterium]|nr:ABC transporter ATP-binding protein [Bacillota bacterium]
MIEVKELSKSFDEIRAIDNISARIEDGHVFGLIGTNGAGKSTFMRMLCGVLKPEAGEILIDGAPVYDNPAVKEKIFYISDDQYFFKSGTPRDMAKLYKTCYPAFDEEKWKDLLHKFGLDEKRKINTFSKGMKKQLSVICGISAGTKYLFCDETFDGLDPVMRQAVKALFVREIDERGLTPVIASHNLRELEDICEYVGLLHKGGILLEKDIDDMKLNIHKLQCVIREEEMLRKIKNSLDVVTVDNRGSLYTVTVRGNKESILEFMELLNPVFYELLPLSLEEIFISETEVKGYDVKALLF